ncbi:hypothetical protein AAJCM20276_01640 [Acetobacter aceti]|uniref:Uncharacterized protein n=1 Tax=Acetobacter aceti TaxID=435 RepID=A0A6S6PF60_ACEAC|nr:hypothetical protein AAJCM20276_01640 [Acetobacter aceti]
MRVRAVWRAALAGEVVSGSAEARESVLVGREPRGAFMVLIVRDPPHANNSGHDGVV